MVGKTFLGTMELVFPLFVFLMDRNNIKTHYIMKKIFITLLAVMAMSISSVFAQNAQQFVGDKTIGVDIGVGYAGVGTAVSFDYTFLDFGRGGTLSGGVYAGASFGRDVAQAMIGPMICYRIPVGDSFDFSAKAIVGYSNVSFFSWLGEAGYIGGTYYFSDRIGVGVDLGYGGGTIASAHLSIRL